MPKYLIRADGAVYPYSPLLAASARFKIVDELPVNHVDGIALARERAQARAAAATDMREQQDKRQALRQRDTQGLRKRLAKKPAVDAQAAAEAQRQADAFSGKEH
jgi:hypothetical protein